MNSFIHPVASLSLTLSLSLSEASSVGSGHSIADFPPVLTFKPPVLLSILAASLHCFRAATRGNALILPHCCSPLTL